MHPFRLLCVFLALYAFAGAQQKSLYDVAPRPAQRSAPDTPPPLAKTAGAASIMEATLLPGGYFTLGTGTGLSASTLDDRCDVSYGHPYALTSYAMLRWDGAWMKMEELFPGAAPQVLHAGDTLRAEQELPGRCRVSVSLAPVNGGRAYDVILRIVNLEGAAKSAAGAIVFDPALGKQGDGAVLNGTGAPARFDTVFAGAGIPSPLRIRERAAQPFGLLVACTFPGSAPDRVLLRNWKDAAASPAPVYAPGAFRNIYDAVLTAAWPEADIPAGGAADFVQRIGLEEPDFAGSIFARWDLPASISLQNNTLFPAAFSSAIELTNIGPTTYADLTLDVSTHEKLGRGALPAAFSVGTGEQVWKRVDFAVAETIEDMLVPVTLRCLSGTEPVCEQTRYVFIPGVPLSDTGLTVSIDSSNIASKDVEVFFQSTVTATGAFITGLTRENVFLFENGVRMHDFTLGTASTNGSNAIDLVFALDVTGSMSNEIAAVRDNIKEFADSMTKRGYDYRLGLVTFRDQVAEVIPFTANVLLFKAAVQRQNATGGDDLAENSLDALLSAAGYAFRPAANKMIVWITDAPYHEANTWTSLTRKKLTDTLLARGLLCHCIGSSTYKSAWYDPVVVPTGGSFYDINGKFRDILLDIARQRFEFRYRAAYASALAPNASRTLRVEVHTRGLGGFAERSFVASGGGAESAALSGYPNPFNPSATIAVRNPEGLRGVLEIFSPLGALLERVTIDGGRALTEHVWQPGPSGSGVYRAVLTLLRADGTTAAREHLPLVFAK